MIKNHLTEELLRSNLRITLFIFTLLFWIQSYGQISFDGFNEIQLGTKFRFKKISKEGRLLTLFDFGTKYEGGHHTSMRKQLEGVIPVLNPNNFDTARLINDTFLILEIKITKHKNKISSVILKGRPNIQSYMLDHFGKPDTSYILNVNQEELDAYQNLKRTKINNSRPSKLETKIENSPRVILWFDSVGNRISLLQHCFAGMYCSFELTITGNQLHTIPNDSL